MPVFNLILDGDHFYGFPAHGIPGVKLGRYERQGESGDPDGISREPTIEDEARLRELAERYLPEGAGPTVALKTCLFENTPDEHFLLGLHPEHENVIIAGGGSGHAFKFASVIGEIVGREVRAQDLDQALLHPSSDLGDPVLLLGLLQPVCQGHRVPPLPFHRQLRANSLRFFFDVSIPASPAATISA